MATITHTHTTVDVHITGAEPIEGRAGYSGRRRTVRPVSVHFTTKGDSVDLRGPQVRPDGGETASWFTVTVDRDGAPQWLLDVIAEAQS